MNKDKNAWRHELKVGDLVEMKVGGMAVITKVRRHDDMWFGEDEPSPPHIEMIYCDDGEHGSCSSYRIERMISEVR
jgi:hypothetical protein